jgi:hypothetical protein
VFLALLAALSVPDLILSAPLLTASRALFIAASVLRFVFDDKSSFYQTEKKSSMEIRSDIITLSLVHSDALFAASI